MSQTHNPPLPEMRPDDALIEQTLTVSIPAGLSEADARLAFAIGLFQEDHVSVGWAAQAAGLSYRAFLDALHERGLPAYIYDDVEDMRRELEGVRALIAERREEAS